MTEPTEFKWDVFLSHAKADKDTVRDIANRLKSDGVRVWFDEWEVRPGDSIPAKVEDGLEHSRVLVLCMSKAAFGSDWAQLESHTFRFKDPLNHNRRFIPLRLDDTPAKGSLAQFNYIDWRTDARRHSYSNFLNACRPSERPRAVTGGPLLKGAEERQIYLRHRVRPHNRIWSYDFDQSYGRVITTSEKSVRLWDVKTGQCVSEYIGHSNTVRQAYWDSDGERILSCSADKTLKLWDAQTGQCIYTLSGHNNEVRCAAWAYGQTHVLSGGGDFSLRLWNLESGQCVKAIDGHSRLIRSLVWSEGGEVAITGSSDGTIGIWDVQRGKFERAFSGHGGRVLCVALSADERFVLSGSEDGTMRLWDLITYKCAAVFEGHIGRVDTVSWHEDGRLALTGGSDRTVRIWDLRRRACLGVLNGHSASVATARWANNELAVTGDIKSQLRTWDISRSIEEIPEANPTFLHVSNSGNRSNSYQYTNAKVLLVGNSAAGKTGLSNRLALDTYKETDSTVGAWATQWKLPLPPVSAQHRGFQRRS